MTGVISFQAIQVKFLGPTNYRGARYKATCAAKSITRGRDYALNNADDAYQVALELAQELGWMDNMEMTQGVLPSGDYCHVLKWKENQA